MRLHLTALTSIAVLLTTACSNGSRDNPPAAAAVAPAAVITRDNALQAASAVYRSAHDRLRVARIAGAFFQVAPPEPTARPNAPGAPALLAQQVPGLEGGSAIFTWNDRDGDRHYTTGDSFGIACTDFADQGLALTGDIGFDDVEIHGDVVAGLTWILTARLHLSDLVVTNTNTAASVTLDLDLPFGREQRATVHLLTLVPDRDCKYGARTLQFGTTLGRNDYQLDFRMGLLAEGSVTMTSTASSDTATDPELGGVLHFHTKTVLTGVQALPDPAEGTLEIRGAGRTKLIVAPVDFFNLELRLDEDGDGKIDVTIPAEWAALQ